MINASQLTLFPGTYSKFFPGRKPGNEAKAGYDEMFLKGGGLIHPEISMLISQSKSLALQSWARKPAEFEICGLLKNGKRP